MSEENETAEGGEEVAQEQQQEVSVDPAIEGVARKLGYRGKDEMKDPSKWVDPETFIINTGKYKDDYRKEIKNLRRDIGGITATISQVAAQKHAEGVREAEQRLVAAKESFDPEAIEKAAIAVQQAKQVAAATSTEPVPAEVNEWCERNPWFDTNKMMKADALEYRERFLKRNPDATLAETLEYIEEKIKRDYPDKFKPAKEEAEPRKKPAAGPEGVQTGGGGGKEAWERQEKELTDWERNLMNTQCEQLHNGKPIMTKKQWIENLAQSGRFGR